MNLIPDALQDVLANAISVTALTGAGISAESGIPTFREAQTGLWAQYDPMELATPQAFRKNPDLVWQWYAWRRGLIRKASPNPAHFALARLGKELHRFSLITQNVDNLHQVAGSPEVIELHGNIFRTRCSADDRMMENAPDPEDHAPDCPHCGARQRPDVVWFTENLPRQAFDRAVTATEQSDLFLVIGTSGLVHPAAALPAHARSHGAVVLEINPQETPITRQANFSLLGAAGELLPEIAAHILQKNR